jgi:hypothetical protein
MIVGSIGAVLTLAALPFSSSRMTTGRFLLSLGLLTLHVAASVAYYIYAQDHNADTHGYYYGRFYWLRDSFELGTALTFNLTQFLKNELGGSYLECFIFFQSLGFWGLILLMRTFQEIDIKTRARFMTLPAYLLFLPTLNFWTAGIGKDAPVFFGISLFAWAVIELRARLLYLLAGLVLVLLFRPHIAFVIMVSLSVALLIHRKMPTGNKVMIAVTAFAGTFILGGAVQSTFDVDVIDPSSIGNYFQERDEIGRSMKGGTASGDVAIPLRFFSLLARPFFFDARDTMGVVASLENIVILFIFLYIIKKWKTLLVLFRDVMFVKFSVIFWVFLTVILTLTYYNVGLGLRQRIMGFPALLSIFVAMWSIRHQRSTTTVTLPIKVSYTGGQPDQYPTTIFR